MENKNIDADFVPAKFAPPPPYETVQASSSPIVLDVQENDDSENRCCFGSCCHITTCVTIIGSLEIIGSIAAIILACIALTSQDNDHQIDSYMIVLIVLSAILFLCAVMMIYGAQKERPAWILPNLIYQYIQLAATVVLAIFAFIVSFGARGDGQTIMLQILSFGIQIAVQIFLAYQMQKCFRYLKEKR